jgi:hypothetical protein
LFTPDIIFTISESYSHHVQKTNTFRDAVITGYRCGEAAVGRSLLLDLGPLRRDRARPERTDRDRFDDMTFLDLECFRCPSMMHVGLARRKGQPPIRGCHDVGKVAGTASKAMLEILAGHLGIAWTTPIRPKSAKGSLAHLTSLRRRQIQSGRDARGNGGEAP